MDNLIGTQMLFLLVHGALAMSKHLPSDRCQYSKWLLLRVTRKHRVLIHFTATNRSGGSQPSISPHSGDGRWLVLDGV